MGSLRSIKTLEGLEFNDEDEYTKTSDEQIQVENSVLLVYKNFHRHLLLDDSLPKLNKREHWDYAHRSLSYLPPRYECLDASRTWLCYWSLHSMSLLLYKKLDNLNNLAQFIARCQHPSGGFGGGPGQLPHLATTYAAVNALCIIGNEDAYKVINRKTLRNFLWSLRSPEGAFFMHKDGEVDIRGVYCALAVANLTNIGCSKLFDGTAEWIVGCQTYEGGFSGCPGMEAHGGYTFCGLAALFMLHKPKLCDSQSLLRWLVNRQMKLEGGFQGRTNKLVDGCYSFWQAATIALLQELLALENVESTEYLFNQSALQEYVLICCQYKNGGLIDKPGKPCDLYHTCYTLSGLAVAQTNSKTDTVIGSPDNLVNKINLLHNIDAYKAYKAFEYFKNNQEDSVCFFF